MAKAKPKPPAAITELVRALARQAAQDYFQAEQRYTQAANDNAEGENNPQPRLDCQTVRSVNDHDPGEL